MSEIEIEPKNILKTTLFGGDRFNTSLLIFHVMDRCKSW